MCSCACVDSFALPSNSRQALAEALAPDVLMLTAGLVIADLQVQQHKQSCRVTSQESLQGLKAVWLLMRIAC